MRHSDLLPVQERIILMRRRAMNLHRQYWPHNEGKRVSEIEDLHYTARELEKELRGEIQ